MNPKIPNKVVITCTPDGYSVTVFSNETEVATERFKMVGQGHAAVDGEEVDWTRVTPFATPLPDAIDDAGMDVFGISCALFDVRYDYGDPE